MTNTSQPAGSKDELRVRDSVSLKTGAMTPALIRVLLHIYAIAEPLSAAETRAAECLVLWGLATLANPDVCRSGFALTLFGEAAVAHLTRPLTLTVVAGATP